MPEPQRRATLSDIARAVGVSEATVSRALRGDPQIGERTREAVRLVAAELEYVPNHAAQSLAKSSTLTLGLMVPDVVDSMHGLVVTGFERVALAAGYAVLVVNGFRDSGHEARGFDVFRRHQADAVALCGTLSAIPDIALALRSTPIVLIGPESTEEWDPGSMESDTIAVLRVDERQGMSQLVAHLLDTGRSRIAYVNGHDLRSNRVRREALARALEAASVEPALWEYPTVTSREGYLHLVDLIEKERPEALVCYDDERALYLLAALRARGLRVPDDVAVTGFDDVPFAQLACPALTTIAQPAEDLGARAAAMLLARIKSGEKMRSAELLPALVRRESTA